MPDLKSVKEIGRGKDWVKFLATWEPGVTFGQIELWHDLWSKKHSDEFGCSIAEVMPFSFGENRAIFKFRTEPYSMKSNDCYRYIDAFDKSLRGPGVSGEKPAAEETEKKFDAKSFVDELFGTLKEIGPIAGIDFSEPLLSTVRNPDVATIDVSAGKDGKYSCPIAISENPIQATTASNFRTVNDVRVKSLISRLKGRRIRGII